MVLLTQCNEPSFHNTTHILPLQNYFGIQTKQIVQHKKLNGETRPSETEEHVRWQNNKLHLTSLFTVNKTPRSKSAGSKYSTRTTWVQELILMMKQTKQPITVGNKIFTKIMKPNFFEDSLKWGNTICLEMPSNVTRFISKDARGVAFGLSLDFQSLQGRSWSRKARWRRQSHRNSHLGVFLARSFQLCQSIIDKSDPAKIMYPVHWKNSVGKPRTWQTD